MNQHIEKVVDRLISEGQIPPDYREEMVRTLDSAMRQHTRRFVREIGRNTALRVVAAQIARKTLMELVA